MILRLKIKDWKMVCSIRKTSYVTGVTSKIDDNYHILMWDFDKTSLIEVIESLSIVQYHYHLPDIQILESNRDILGIGNYHAYCFTKTLWSKAVVIVADTYGIDWDFVRLALYRGNFTLRISEKLGKSSPKLVYTLIGDKKPDCNPTDLQDFIKYEIWINGELK